MHSSLRVGIVGLGMIALDEHVPAWRSVADCEIVAVADPAPAAADLAAKLGLGRHYHDYHDMLCAADLDIVDVTLPSALHAEVAVAALRSGHHVLCEKPMATCAVDAEQMLQAARQSDRKLMIAQCFRYHPATQRLKELVDRGLLGDIYYASASWLRRRRVPARPGFTDRRLSGGGPLLDLGVHMLDLVWWIMGCPVPRLAQGATFDHLLHRTDLGGEWGEWDHQAIDVEDLGAGMIRFENDAVFNLETSWMAMQPKRERQRVMWLGTHGGALWPRLEVTSESHRIPWNLRVAEQSDRCMHRDCIADFARAVIEERPVPIAAHETVQTTLMLDALYESARAGCEAPIRVIPASREAL